MFLIWSKIEIPINGFSTMRCISQKQTDVIVSDLLKFCAKIRSEEKRKLVLDL